MATPFADIRTAAGNNMDRSVQWYVRAVRQYARGVNTFQEAQGTDLGKEARNIDVGKMYLFTYDPVPLVVIVDTIPGGFSGINLHYLAPTLRANLLDKLLPTMEIDDKSLLKSVWTFVNNFSRFPEVRGSVKKYLGVNVTGRMIEVNPKNWQSAIFLPVQKFVGASDRYVYRETMEKPERTRRQSMNIQVK